MQCKQIIDFLVFIRLYLSLNLFFNELIHTSPQLDMHTVRSKLRHSVTLQRKQSVDHGTHTPHVTVRPWYKYDRERLHECVL